MAEELSPAPEGLRPLMGADCPLESTKLDHRVELAKTRRLRLAYIEDGRDDPEHPHHGTFTGLALLFPSSQEAGDPAQPSPAAASGNDRSGDGTRPS